MNDDFDRVTTDPDLETELLDRLDEDLDTHTVAALAIERGCRPPGWAPGDPVPGIVTVYPDDGDDPVLAWHTDKLGGGEQETADDIRSGR